MTPNAAFKSRLRAGAPLMGCFIKTPHPSVIEVLGASPLDFLILDAEHAPFDRGSIDVCMLAARVVGCPLLVRVPSDDPTFILNILDSGAAGIVVAHVTTPSQAEHIAHSLHYGPGGRGLAGTTRAGRYGEMPLVDHVVQARNEVSLICQIEDKEAVPNIRSIAAISDVDALFVGRADLSLSYGYDSFNSDEINQIAADVMSVEGASTGLYCAPGENLTTWQRCGASFFVTGSDHSFMIKGAKQLANSFKSLHSDQGDEA